MLRVVNRDPTPSSAAGSWVSTRCTYYLDDETTYPRAGCYAQKNRAGHPRTRIFQVWKTLPAATKMKPEWTYEIEKNAISGTLPKTAATL